MRRILLGVCWVVIMIQAGVAAEKPAPPKGPPPRFLTLEKVDAEKSEATFDVQVLAQSTEEHPRILKFPDGSQRLTLGTKPGYVHLGEGYKLPFKKAHWYDGEGKALDGDSVWKDIKPGTTVVLSADGKAVDPAYLQLFKKETRVLVVPVEDLPVAYMPHFGGTIPVEEVPKKPAKR